MFDSNPIIVQGFHWYTDPDGGYWDRLAVRAKTIADAGAYAVWLPPAYKGHAGPNDVGYGVYDLYDLGEFDQKGSVRTRYGTREQYLACVEALRRQGLLVLADMVLNHRLGADGIERGVATPHSHLNRLEAIGEPREIESWCHFHFPGRGGVHSDFQWHWHHFDSVDYDAAGSAEPGAIFLFEGKRFSEHVAQEHGNYAYLMGCNLDFYNDEVQEEMIRWGRWYLDTTGVDGFRLDAIKHIPAWYFPKWLDAMERHVGRRLPVIGEYWSANVDELLHYVDAVGGRMSVFDVPLHYNFHVAGRANRSYDMRTLLDGTLLRSRPGRAVTFVENHDSQPLQALESPIEDWFKPLAYAVILLRSEGYPCIFLPDYVGAEYEDVGGDGARHRIVIPSMQDDLDRLIRVRRQCAWGRQVEYFDHERVVGWVRLGTPSRPQALAVLMSNGDRGEKRMQTGRPDTRFIDALGRIDAAVTTDAEGFGVFHCAAGSVSAWVEAGPWANAR